jgi:FKBP-type peptidyl-prolyl cis-trans isomerase
MMKIKISAAIATLAFAATAYCQDEPPATAKPELKSTRDKASYSIGLNIGHELKQAGHDLDIAKLAAGIADAYAGKKPQLNEEEIDKVMREFGEEFQERKLAEFKELSGTNKKKGDDFLAANKKKQGVVTTKSGLQYKVLKEGKGPKPKKTDMVTTHYVGTLLDGTEFDSSVKRGEPATFPLNRVIAGWTEALQLMPVGSKWRIYVPGELAYGDQGSPPAIGPNATLVFDVELLKIEDPTESTPPAEELPQE